MCEELEIDDHEHDEHGNCQSDDEAIEEHCCCPGWCMECLDLSWRDFI